MPDRVVNMDGVIASSGFASGDRIVVGDWADGPLGAMVDVMWARPDGATVLLAPDDAVAAFVASVYAFDEVAVVGFDVRRDDRVLSIDAGPLSVRMAAGPAVPFPPRPAWVTRYIEAPIARAAMGVRTYGRSPTGVEEWYRTVSVRRLVWAGGRADGRALGGMRDVDPPLGVGFSEPPPWPSMVRVRPRLRFPSA